MSEQPSMYPSLHAYMYNLYHAGMSIEDVMSAGLAYAECFVSREDAAIQLHTVAIELGLSLDQQIATTHERGGIRR